jgi:NADH:ubiquinone oxidoreductase subunit
MTITTRLFSLLHGKLVGTDQFGNRYFKEKRTPKNRREKRWVIYHGKAEASKIPAQWHGWMHYTFDKPPTERTVLHYPWEKQHQPNLTGTKGAYAPDGSLLAGGKHAPTTADYEPWRP